MEKRLEGRQACVIHKPIQTDNGHLSWLREHSIALSARAIVAVRGMTSKVSENPLFCSRCLSAHEPLAIWLTVRQFQPKMTRNRE